MRKNHQNISVFDMFQIIELKQSINGRPPIPQGYFTEKNIKKNQVSLGIKGGKQNLNFLGNFLCLVSVARVGSEKNYIHFLFLFLQNECKLDQLGLFFENKSFIFARLK